MHRAMPITSYMPCSHYNTVVMSPVEDMLHYSTACGIRVATFYSNTLTAQSKKKQKNI